MELKKWKAISSQVLVNVGMHVRMIAAQGELMWQISADQWRPMLPHDPRAGQMFVWLYAWGSQAWYEWKPI